MLSSQTIVYIAAITCMARPCVAAEPADLVYQVEHLGPLPQIPSDIKQRVIASLPTEGEVKSLSPEYCNKLESVAAVVNLHGHRSDYLFKVVRSPQARIAIHAGFVVLVTDTALRLLTSSQLRALVAHEIGHRYVWEGYEEARKRHNCHRVRELELFCDAVAVYTLIKVGVPPSALIDALRKIAASDERNGFETTGDSHPTIAERSWLNRELTKRLTAHVEIRNR